MSSIVTLTELGIGFCILFNKMCVKLSGMYRNKYRLNKQNRSSDVAANVLTLAHYHGTFS